MRIFRRGDNTERKMIWLDACQQLGVSRDTANAATNDFLFLDFLLRNTDRHHNNFGLIRDVESFEIRPAPIFDSGASLWNGMDPEAITNEDYPAKPFRLDDYGDADNAYWQLGLIDDWDRYDLGMLDEVPELIRAQLATNRRLSADVIDAICSAMQERIGIIRKLAR